MRIFRTLILLTGVAVLMPSPPDDGQRQAAAAPALVGSATMAFADAASFCSRQPQVCQTAGYVASKLQAKAKYSVRLIYEWASESTAEPHITSVNNQAGADPIETGSTAVAKAGSTASNGQSSLRIEDLIPAWRGPAAKKS